MFGLFNLFFPKGGKLMNEFADEIGVDRKIYKAALTEVGVNWETQETIFNGIEIDSITRNEKVELLAKGTISAAWKGGVAIDRKFPNQPEMHKYLEAVSQYAAKHGG